jgi:hypothetical protein
VNTRRGCSMGCIGIRTGAGAPRPLKLAALKLPALKNLFSSSSRWMLRRTEPRSNAFIHGRRHFKQPVHQSRDTDQKWENLPIASILQSAGNSIARTLLPDERTSNNKLTARNRIATRCATAPSFHCDSAKAPESSVSGAGHSSDPDGCRKS